MTTDNKSEKTEEVHENQTKVEEVVKSGLTENEIISDILGSSEESSPAEKEDEGEEKPESEEETEGGSDEPEEKKEETTTEEESEKDETTVEEEPEKKPGDKKTNSEEEVFATIGGQKFDSKENLVEFVKSNIGYNTWLTGQLKSLHPELFNADGSIKSKDLKKLVETGVKSAKGAAEVISEVAEKDPEDVTEEDKEDVEKAKAILRPLGVVFADDPEYQKLKKNAEKIDNQEYVEAQTVIQEFETKHPLLKEHRVAVADLMDKNGYDLETAWRVHKVVMGITEEPSQTQKKTDVVVKKAADSAIPTTIKKQSGHLPSSGGKDFMDDLITINR